jgi:hypothetical protein
VKGKSCTFSVSKQKFNRAVFFRRRDADDKNHHMPLGSVWPSIGCPWHAFWFVYTMMFKKEMRLGIHHF